MSHGKVVGADDAALEDFADTVVGIAEAVGAPVVAIIIVGLEASSVRSRIDDETLAAILHGVANDTEARDASPDRG